MNAGIRHISRFPMAARSEPLRREPGGEEMQRVVTGTFGYQLSRATELGGLHLWLAITPDRATPPARRTLRLPACITTLTGRPPGTRPGEPRSMAPTRRWLSTSATWPSGASPRRARAGSNPGRRQPNHGLADRE